MSDESKTILDYFLSADFGTFRKLYEIVIPEKDDTKLWKKLEELTEQLKWILK